MQYALVNDSRIEAFTGGKGVCPTCGKQMIAKCGSRIINHWAHVYQKNCDPWRENETQWHRNWKNQFPEECREVCHSAPDGEIHRADVKTSTGIIIEFQHSAITDEERLSRERFYGNLVWVIDGSSFKHNFDILHMLPDPKAEFSQDLVWAKGSRRMKGAARGIFIRLSENPGSTKIGGAYGWIHGIDTIKQKVEELYRGHHQYDWIKPRKTWLEATCPVYIDFGDWYLARLEIYDGSLLPCVRLISKRKFLHDVSAESSIQNIATKFYPIDNQ